MLLFYHRKLVCFWDVVFPPLLKQVFDWATGIVVELGSTDKRAREIPASAVAPAFSVTEISLCGDPQP